jgi:RNA polymerase sigma-70 factor (ECF subfamily)
MITGELGDDCPAPQTAADRLMQLMNDHERPLSAYLYSRLRDANTVRDCLQDTFLRAYLHLRSGRSVEVGWLYRVAHNRVMDEYRRRGPPHAELAGMPWDDRTERRLEIQEALDELPELDRQVLFLCCCAGFRTDEIGERLGVSGAAVRQRLYRARGRIRSFLRADA